MKCLPIWGVGNLLPVIYYLCYRPEPHGHDAAGSGFASNGNAQNCCPFRHLPLNAVLCRSSANGVTMTSFAGRRRISWESAMGEEVSGIPPSETQPEERLDSWKEIAGYLKRDVTTVQRWEKREGMPVHRHLHDKLGSVYASKAELDAWARSRNIPAEQESGKANAVPAAPAAAAPSSSVSSPTESSPTVPFLTRRTRFVLLAVGLAGILLLGGYLIRRNTRAVSSSESRLLIGVTPLQNLSGDPAQNYFVQGLTEEIITQLGQLNPERIGVVRYRSSAPAQPDGSQYLLEGSVRRQDEHARIAVRLVRVADEATVWTESFDRDVGDVLALQSDIAQRIGGELQVKVLGRADRKPVAPEVAEAYLRGRFELSQGVFRLTDAAKAHFERAIALDPSYAPAHAGLADFYRSRAVANDEGSGEEWRLAEKHANDALALDSESAETHVAIAMIKLVHDWDWSAGREHALRALQLNPSLPEAHSVYGLYLTVAGDIPGALAQRKQALAVDPYRQDLKDQLGREYFFARDYQELVASDRRVLASDANSLDAHTGLCMDLGRLKLFDEAAAECSKELVLEGRADWAAEFSRNYRDHGYEAASLKLAKNRLEDLLKSPTPDLWDLAGAYGAAGMKKEGIDTLFLGLKTHETGLLQIRVDPDFDSIREEPGYTELIKQIGFPNE
jgi:TolB-like protein/tetratricopeptide (TPR) repeat protein